MAIEKVSITEVMERLGIPSGSKYLGYVVHLPIEDEFLAFYLSKNNSIQKGFSKSPESALKYKNYKKALRHAKSCNKKAEVWLSFDIGRQIIVSPVDAETSVDPNKKKAAQHS